MKTRDIVSTFNKVLEFLDDLKEDVGIPQYYIDKSDLLIEEIETLLGQSEVDE